MSVREVSRKFENALGVNRLMLEGAAHAGVDGQLRSDGQRCAGLGSPARLRKVHQARRVRDEYPVMANSTSSSVGMRMRCRMLPLLVIEERGERVGALAKVAVDEAHDLRQVGRGNGTIDGRFEDQFRIWGSLVTRVITLDGSRQVLVAEVEDGVCEGVSSLSQLGADARAAERDLAGAIAMGTPLQVFDAIAVQFVIRRGGVEWASGEDGTDGDSERQPVAGPPGTS